MRKSIVSISLISFLFILVSCSTEKESLPDQIANNYGLKGYNATNNIEFTWKVIKNNNSTSRHWNWDLNTNEVVYIDVNDTISFNHKNLKNEEEINLDKKFINDTYWLLFPLHLEWDKENYQYTIEKNILAPIGETKTTKLTIEYTNGDGYSPNDSYELYIDYQHEIIEWLYRKGGSETPSLITTWQKHEIHNGIKIPTEFVGKDGNFKLAIENIVIK